ncbi:Histone-lysine N-methyltransferase SUVR5-like protein [Drosera capensis]
MEVVAHSTFRQTDESDHAQENGVVNVVYNQEAKPTENHKQLHLEGKEVDQFSFHEVSASKRMKFDTFEPDEELKSPSSQNIVSSGCEMDVDSGNLSNDFPGFDDDDLGLQNSYEEHGVSFANSQVVVDTVESGISSDFKNKELYSADLKLPDSGEAMALWVKWGGKWRAGIKCEKADWPLAIVQAKPTHDGKSYVVIFFPCMKNYSWADTLLICPIDKRPEPIVHPSHEIGVQMVKDLTVARRFIMQKLAVGMLNIIDQLHLQALIESARNVTLWKEFAMESSRCKDYTDLGRMLVRLQNMLLKEFINADWLSISLKYWVQRCENAPSAESVELLKKELEHSILWDEVTFVRNSQGQPALGSEWKSWKQEAMKWFSASHPVTDSKDVDRSCKNKDQFYDSSLITGPQNSQKRAKLEIRRAEPHSTVAENRSSYNDSMPEIDSRFFVGNSGASNDLTPATLKQEHLSEGAAPLSSPAGVADRWDELVLDNSNAESIHNTVVDAEPINIRMPGANSLYPVRKSRQCKAYIEAKGRQCVRWASEGDMYCCVHLGTRFVGQPLKPAEGTPAPTVNSQMCEGTTTLGTKCKHHALQGSVFCKKHGPRDHVGKRSLPAHQFKRKFDQYVSLSGDPYPDNNLLVDRSMEEDRLNDGSSSIKMLEHSTIQSNSTEVLHCIGLGPQVSSLPCLESPKRHSLYCEKHLPSWLKRARNGKSRIVSKEVFVKLLAGCPTWEHKICLHQACELFYKLFRSILSLRNQVPREIQFQWALSEASKDPHVTEYLGRLVSYEKERIKRIWGFGLDNEPHGSSMAEEQRTMGDEEEDDSDGTLKCNFCSIEFSDDYALGNHWIDSHNKEAQWFFKGYACAICLDSFTNRKVLEAHVQERHHAQFVEHCMLVQCIPCGSHFGNSEELWVHVLSAHSDGFRQLKTGVRVHSVAEGSMQKPFLGNIVSVENSSESTVKRYICRFCGLRFDLLPDLGRHHQAAHMAPSSASGRPSKRGLRFYSYRLKSGRLSRPRFKRGIGGVSYRIKNKVAASLKKRILASSAASARVMNAKAHVTQTAGLSGLTGLQCLSVAKILFAEAQKTKVHPSNHEILSIARCCCCRVNLEAMFEEKYGVLPERLCVKAAKLCSEHSIHIGWHQEGFSCPKGCKAQIEQNGLPLLALSTDKYESNRISALSDLDGDKWEKDESHYVIDSSHLSHKPSMPTIILCDDISDGQEAAPIPCMIDKNLVDSLHVPSVGFDGKLTFMPWESFSYVTKPLLGQSLQVDIPNLQLGCGCAESICRPATCDHVYLFDNDFEDAKDIFGKPMRGRFPYDDEGRILLEEGYPVYECNDMCKCSELCSNRVLQDGVQAKIEVFKTVKKGWAVRAGEEILRGTFVCELIGEVLVEDEAEKRRKRYGSEGSSYLFDARSLMNDKNNFLEGQVPCVIDATKYGNVSRFMNHSCSPNLVNHVVLVDSMETQLAHIGLFANRDIAVGEELTFDYHHETTAGKGHPCLCGTSSCRGRFD